MKRSLTLVLTAALLLAGITGCNTARAAETPITVVSREEGSGTRGAFIELFGIEVKGSDGSRKDMTTKEAVIVNKTDVMLTNITSDTNAIGYISLGSLSGTVKALDIDGVAATADNVKNGTYPVVRPFIIATKQEPSAVTQDFIRFILSKDGQDVIASSYIAVDENAAPYLPSAIEGKITIEGSSSVTPIMEKLIEAYKIQKPDVTIELQMTDSSAGMTAAMDGTCDIGMASRALKESELAQLTGTGIALDGIAVIVNTANPVSGLTNAQVNSIFTGETTTWESIK